MAVIEDLTEQECYLYSILSDPSGLDQAEFLWRDSSPVNKTGIWRAWPFQWFWYRDLSKYQIEMGSRCIKEGSLVLTDIGWLPIEQVQIGQKVLTHKNRWRTVLDVMDQGERETVAVYGQGPPLPLITTPDHKFWARKARRASKPKDGHKGKKLLSPEWIEIQDFQQSDKSQIMATNWSSPARVNSLPIPEQLTGAYISGRQNYVEDLYTKEWMWLYGLFLAEGSVYMDKQYSKVSWCIHRKELEEVCSYFETIGLNYSVALSKKDKSASIIVNSKPLAVWLEANAGRGAVNKELATWVYGLPQHLRQAIFDGLMFGDGHIREDRYEYTSISRKLTLGVVLLAQSLNYACSSYISQKAGTIMRIEGRTSICREAYGLSIRKVDSLRQHRVQIIDDHAWSPVNKVEENGIERVWDLEVEDDHSFVCEGIVVHNSLGKSLSIALRAFCFPFLHPQQQMLVTAPTMIHLKPLVKLIEDKIMDTRLSRLMLPKGGNHGITHDPFDIQFLNGSTIIGRIPRSDGSGLKGCVGPESLILTRDRGFQFIKDVTVEDHVWSHKNRWTKVFSAESFVSAAYKVKGQGAFPLIVSDTHRFYVKNDKSKQPGKTKRNLGFAHWEKVNEFTSSKYSPINAYWSSPKSYNSVDIIYPDFTITNSNRINCESESFWWLVGRYLADGCITSSRKNGHKTRVNFYVHPKDQGLVLDHINNLGISYTIKERAHSSADEISICSVPIAEWLLNYFGKRADGKTLPTFCFTMSEKYRSSLLAGYLSGDGSEREHGKQQRKTSGSASKKLTMGMGTIATTLGYSVGYGVSEIHVTEIMGVPLKKKAFNSYCLRINEKGDRVDTDDEFCNYKIRSVEKVEDQIVYNIVTEDHSYLSDGIISHNTHPLWLEMDEAQDFEEQAWKEIIETLLQGTDEAVWRAHGVTRGVRGGFYERTQPDSGWRIHHYACMSRPTWDDDERQQKIKEYGSRHAPDYKRNILGLHGDSQSPMFDSTRLYNCIAGEHRKGHPRDGEYNNEIYQEIRINSDKLADHDDDIVSLMQFSNMHKSMGKRFWAGMDVGYTNDPSEILIFGETFPKDKEPHLTLLSRVHLERVSHPLQVNAIIHCINFYGLETFAMDSTGNGLPLYQDAQHRFPGHVRKIKGFNFSEKILVDFDKRIDVDLEYDDPIAEAGMMKNVLQYSSDSLRDFVDNQRITLPFDRELVNEFQGQTYYIKRDGLNIYGKKVYSDGSFHALDAARMAILGYKQFEIDQLVESMKPSNEPVMDIFVGDW